MLVVGEAAVIENSMKPVLRVVSSASSTRSPLLEATKPRLPPPPPQLRLVAGGVLFVAPVPVRNPGRGVREQGGEVACAVAVVVFALLQIEVPIVQGVQRRVQVGLVAALLEVLVPVLNCVLAVFGSRLVYRSTPLS